MSYRLLLIGIIILFILAMLFSNDKNAVEDFKDYESSNKSEKKNQ